MHISSIFSETRVQLGKDVIISGSKGAQEEDHDCENECKGTNRCDAIFVEVVFERRHILLLHYLFYMLLQVQK